MNRSVTSARITTAKEQITMNIDHLGV